MLFELHPQPVGEASDKREIRRYLCHIKDSAIGEPGLPKGVHVSLQNVRGCHGKLGCVVEHRPICHFQRSLGVIFPQLGNQGLVVH